MKISIFGLGYVGCVSAACLAEAGHDVVGVDVNPTKVDLLNKGHTPVIEKDLEALIKKGLESGKLRAVSSAAEAVAASDIALICVGTPSNPNNSLNLQYVDKVCAEIGETLRDRKSPFVVCVRSTMVPGSTAEHVLPSLARGLGGTVPERVRVAVNPEFLREGSAVSDYFNPPKTVVGADDKKTAERVASLYKGIEAPVIKTSIKNKKLNISTAYLKPGFAFGGSCLPKDLRAILYKGRSMDRDLPLLSSILPSNDMQIQRAVHMIQKRGKKRLAFLGLSFKPGTDDLRESPLVLLIETFIGKGYDIRIYDENVSLARLVGANKAYIEQEIPHISNLMVSDIKKAVEFGEVIIVGHEAKEFAEALSGLGAGKTVIDLARTIDNPPDDMNYEGFNW
jgi:GDP-mannose 6-dehydrogenase